MTKDVSPEQEDSESVEDHAKSDCEHIPREWSDKIKQFELDWFDYKKFPRFSISSDQTLWLLNMSVSPLPKPRHVDTANMLKSPATFSVSNCYNIPAPLRIRKEYRQLSHLDRVSYHDALNTMKSDHPFESNPTLSAYDFLVTLHRGSMSPAAHGGPAFLPWHRQFLLM